MISRTSFSVYFRLLSSSSILVVLIFIAGCTTKHENHFKSNYTGSDDKGALRKECTFISGANDKLYRHHCKVYDENGKLNQEGDFINDTIPTGWQNYFRADGTLQAKREYYEVSPTIIYLNQVIRFEKNGVDTNFAKSSFYSIVFEKDTVKKGDKLIAFISIKAPYYKNSYMDVTFVNTDGQEIELPGNKTLATLFTADVEQQGEFELQGYLNETEVLGRQGDTLKVNQRKLYFNKKYWVE